MKHRIVKSLQNAIGIGIIFVPFVFVAGLTGCATYNRPTHAVIKTSSKGVLTAPVASTVASKGLEGSEAMVHTTGGEPLAWKDREQAADHIQSWRINGKIAVQTAKQSASATVNWLQRKSQYHIAIIGPLGAQNLRLDGGPGRVVLQSSDGKTYTDRSAEHLLARGWGYNLPVSHLYYWVRGLPSPSLSMRTRFDKSGQLRVLIQQGWVINYLSYVRRGKIALPNKIFISSPSLRVKLIIYQWQV